ncbi:MAG: DUF4199 domain-containing protein [Aureispira sp.]
MNTKAIATLSLKLALIGGVIFFLGRWGLLLMQLQVSDAAVWWFRITPVATLTIGILALKGSQKGYLSFGEGFKLGSLTTLFLALFMSGATWLYMTNVHPNYTQEYEQAYRDFHYNKMMREYIGETWKKDTITQGAIDTVNNGLDLNIQNYTGHLFTVAGQTQTAFVYTIFWGLLTLFTVIVLARKVRE